MYSYKYIYRTITRRPRTSRCGEASDHDSEGRRREACLNFASKPVTSSEGNLWIFQACGQPL